MKRLLAWTFLFVMYALPAGAHSTLVSSVPSADATVVDFPMEFEDEASCPVCMEDEYGADNYLLRLPCGHTLCKCCYPKVNLVCPKCKQQIVTSLVKRKKVQ